MDCNTLQFSRTLNIKKKAHLRIGEAWYCKIEQMKEIKLSENKLPVAKLSLKDRINL